MKVSMIFTATARAIFKTLLLTIASIAVGSSVSFATVYPKAKNTEVLYLGSGVAGVAAVDQIISEAQTSVNAILSTWAVDTVGSPFIQTIRTLANKKVKINMIYDGGATGVEATGDFSCYAAQMISDPALARTPHVICPKTFDKASIDDYLHQKMIIIDAGQPTMKIIVQGGNWTKTANQFVDNYIVLRPIFANQPWVGQSIFSYYKHVWGVYGKLYGVIPTAKPSADIVTKFDSFFNEFKLLNRVDIDQLQHSMEILHRGPAVVRLPDAIQFQPTSVQFVSNDLFENVLKFKPGSLTSSRLGLPDDISTTLVQKIENSKSILLSNYGGEYNYRLKAAVQAAIGNSKKDVELVTNSPAGYKSIAADETSLAALATAFFITIEEMKNYLQEAVKTRNLHVYLSNQYRHTKLGIADSTVWSGSANLTVASSTKNDESMLIYEDARMAHFFRDEVKNELNQSTYFELYLEQAKDYLKQKTWGNSTLEPIVRQYI